MKPQFDHEKLEVHQLEMVFLRWVTPSLANIKTAGPSARSGEVIDQLDRASLSALLNTAEGNDRRQRQTRAKFFDDARGSVTECAACLDAVVAKGISAENEIEEGKHLLIRICSILTKLVERFDSYSSSILREGEEIEDERDHSCSSSSSVVRQGEKIEDEDEDQDEKNL
jgi:four helix bundle protein